MTDCKYCNDNERPKSIHDHVETDRYGRRFHVLLCKGQKHYSKKAEYTWLEVQEFTAIMIDGWNNAKFL